MRRVIIGVLVTIVALMLPLGVAAQNPPDSTRVAVETGATVELLTRAPLGELPPAPSPVVLARITFAQGAGLSMTANPGPALHYVEQGRFAVVAIGAMTLTRDGTTDAIDAGEEFAIEPGDALTIPADSPFEVRNAEATPAVALIVELFPRDPGTTFPAGIDLQPLVGGVATAWPTVAAELSLKRVTIGPGADLSPEPPSACVLTFVEAGTGAYTIERGERQITRAASPAATAQSSDAAPEEASPLATGDAVFAQRGTFSSVRNTGDVSLIVLSLAISNAEPEVATPATDA